MPNRFVPINPGTSQDQAMAVINGNFAQLDNEAVTKTFKQANGNSIVIGRLPNGRNGILLYDNTGKARVLIGEAPDDSRPGIWISKSGIDVINNFS